MAVGILEVYLMNAKGLKGSDFLTKTDPYVEIQYKGQTHRSSVAQGLVSFLLVFVDGGRNPTWNEKMRWRAEYPGSGSGSGSDYKLTVKVIDHDTFSTDDPIGQATVYVEELLEMGVEKGTAELRPTKYNVVDSNLSFVGEILLGVSYSLMTQEGIEEEDFGGWKDSLYD